ncbi:MAG: phosphatidate cytidylyltransferase [Sulfurospirillum sp.]|nr:phosphatidate cytidylyltransferase [Sulfurospirillum sp.]
MDFQKIFFSQKQRIITGFGLLFAVLLFAYIDNLIFTWLVLGCAYMFAFYEAMQLFGAQDNKLFVYAICLWIAALFYPNPEDLIYILLIIFLAIMAHKKQLNMQLIAPFLYPSISMLFLFTLYKDFGMGIFVWLIVIVALSDTGAYFVGKSIGKTPFSLTSPNKTWEGSIGGIVLASFVGTFVGTLHVSFWLAFLVSLAVSVAAVWGDLFESYLKREAGVKDSGTIFPGHGGILDRFDGYLFGSVVMVVLLRGLV